MNIPFLNLAEQYRLLKKEIDQKVIEVLQSGHYVLGKEVREFEYEFAKYHKVPYAIGLASGTDALLLSLRACGIGPGDEVIVPAFTFISTASTVCYAGAKPVFADIDLNSFCMTAKSIESVMTRRTKGIILVHLYGQMADMKPILDLCKKKKLVLIEDVAQAIGAEYNGKKAGTFGNSGCFSFYPTKNLGGLGDGGMVITKNKKLKENLLQLRDHGQSRKYHFDQLGYNSRLDELQAAILRIKFHSLEAWIEYRRKIASRYVSQLKNISDIILPVEISGSRHVYNLFTIRTLKRDKLKEFLSQKGIGTAIHYPYPLPTQKAFKVLGYKPSGYPNSILASKTVLSLPLYAEMPIGHIDYVCDTIREFFLG